MKAKKFISLLSAVVMCASFAMTSVNAAMEVDGETSLITGVPTKAELEARTPQLTLSAVKAESKQDVIDAGVAALAAAQYYKDGFDAYVVTLTATNVGDLAVGYKEGTYEDTDKAGVVVPAMVLNLTNDAKIQKYVIGNMSYTKAKSAGVDGTLNLVFGSATDTSYSYPSFNAETLMGQKLTDPTLTAKFIVSVNTGDSVDLVVEDASFYYVLGNGTVANAVVKKPEVATITLGGAPAPVEPTPVDAEAVAPVVGDEYQNCGFKATVAYDAEKEGVKFVVKDTANGLEGTESFTYAQFVGGALIEGALENITVGLNITNAPLNAVMTATAVLY